MGLNDEPQLPQPEPDPLPQNSDLLKNNAEKISIQDTLAISKNFIALGEVVSPQAVKTNGDFSDYLNSVAITLALLPAEFKSMSHYESDYEAFDTNKYYLSINPYIQDDNEQFIPIEENTSDDHTSEFAATTGGKVSTSVFKNYGRNIVSVVIRSHEDKVGFVQVQLFNQLSRELTHGSVRGYQGHPPFHITNTRVNYPEEIKQFSDLFFDGKNNNKFLLGALAKAQNMAQKHGGQ